MNRREATSLTVVLSWLPAAAYTALIWYLSSRTVDVQFVEHFTFGDKGVHFLEYAVLAALLTHAVQTTWPSSGRRFLTAFWLTIGLGFADELHQAYVPGRSADVLDLLADALGASCAIGVCAAVQRLRSDQRSEPPAASDEQAV